jgi:hypothetical protein
MKQLLRRGHNNKYVLTREVKILGRYKGGPFTGPTHEPNLLQDEIYEAITTART